MLYDKKEMSKQADDMGSNNGWSGDPPLGRSTSEPDGIYVGRVVQVRTQAEEVDLNRPVRSH